jgi:DNA-binding NarL/FixJ family response regulator
MNTPHVRGITCAFDASYGYHTWEMSLMAITHKQPHVPPPIAQKLDVHKVKPKTTHKFTPREQQIWELIVQQGASNKQIANRLHISEAGVKQHVGRMLKKHALRNRTQLATIT